MAGFLYFLTVFRLSEKELFLKAGGCPFVLTEKSIFPIIEQQVLGFLITGDW